MAMWSEKNWDNQLFQTARAPQEYLYHYSRVFNTVEGNTTFYALPKPEIVTRWYQDTPDDFLFTLKLPQEISHKLSLRFCETQLSQFFKLMAPLQNKLGLVKLQLPAQFGPDNFHTLEQFLRNLPQGYQYGVEVRHLSFFNKGEMEKRFNGLLMTLGINRIIMDSRPVFAAPADNPAIIHAQQQKPKVPVHAIATSDFPTVRFIGDIALERNSAHFLPWVKKINSWVNEGKQPYLFIHTADNIYAPKLAEALARQIGQAANWLHLPKPEFDQFSLL